MIASRDGATTAYASGATEPELRQAIEVARAATGPTLVVLDDLESAVEKDWSSSSRSPTSSETGPNPRRRLDDHPPGG